MPGRMAIGGYKNHLAITEHVVLPIDELIVQRVVEVDRAWTIVLDASRMTCRRHFRLLHQNRRMWKKLIAAAMVKVQMGVDHMRNIIRLQPCPGELADHI